MNELAKVQLDDMRGWIADCQWADMLTQDDIDELTDEQIVKGIERHYVGGVAQFVRDGA